MVLASVLLAGTAQAQDQPILLQGEVAERQSVRDLKPRAQCFRGHPLPVCRSYFITEAQFGYQLFGSEQGGDLHGFVLGGDIGWMRNVSSRNAIGVAVGANNLYITAGPRYRRWLTEATALDVGLSAAWQPGRVEIVELHTAMMYGERIGLWVNATHDFGRGDPSLAIGVQTGSEPGLIAYGLGAAFTVFYVWRAISVSD